jgi:ABC-type cobalamin transport system permease subunit
MYPTINRLYINHQLNNAGVANAVAKGWITYAEYYSITADLVQMKVWVANGSITPEQYKEITGQDYVA